MKRARLLLALGVSLILPYLYAASLGDLRERTDGFLIAFFIAFIIYALSTILALQLDHLSGWYIFGVFALAVGMCAILVFTQPALSDDMYRYVWDGRVQAQGIGPYHYPPSAAELSSLRDQAIWPNINRKSAVTIYPPMAQVVFAFLWRIWPDSVRWFQVVMAFGGLVAGSLLVGLLDHLGRSASRVIIFLWSPLLIFETAHAAHLDGLVIPLLVGAWWARGREKDSLSGVLLGMATAMKLYPAILFPALWRPRHPEGRWRMPLSFVGTLVLFFLPFLISGGIQVFSFFPTYLGETFNKSPFVIMLFSVIGQLGGRPEQVVPVLMLFVVGVISIWMITYPSRDGESAIRRCVWLIGAVSLLSQNLFSWYMLWLLPLLAIFLSSEDKSSDFMAPGWLNRFPLRFDAWTGWWLFCGLIGLSYTFFIRWKPVPPAIWGQYLPLYFFMGVDLVRQLWKAKRYP